RGVCKRLRWFFTYSSTTGFADSISAPGGDASQPIGPTTSNAATSKNGFFFMGSILLQAPDNCGFSSTWASWIASSDCRSPSTLASTDKAKPVLLLSRATQPTGNAVMNPQTPVGVDSGAMPAMPCGRSLAL